MNGWISVADRLPEIGDRVIVFGVSDGWAYGEPADVIGGVLLNNSDPIMWGDECGEAVQAVTHWMPLPLPPEVTS